MDNARVMDKHPEYVAAALEHLRQRGVQVELGRARKRGATNHAGPRLRLQYAGHDVEYTTHLWPSVGPDNAGAVVEMMRDNGTDALLLTDYVSPRLGEILRAERIQFIDAAGNANLEHPPIVISIIGRKRAGDTRVFRRAAGRAFQPTGLRVVFALLCHPDWIRLPYRELARVSDVAHGSVGEVVLDLRSRGFVGDMDRRRRLLQRGRLQLQWAEAYARVLRAKLWIGRYQAADLRRLADPELTQDGFRVGGEIAAARLATNLQPSTAVVYGDAPTTNALHGWRLTPDPEGNVEFLRKFWSFGDRDAFTPAPLVHADLLVSGDQRCLEAAREIHEQIDTGSL